MKKSKVQSIGVTLRKRPNKFSYQNANMLIKFRAGENFSFLQEFKISFELRFTTFSQKKISKNPKNKSL